MIRLSAAALALSLTASAAGAQTFGRPEATSLFGPYRQDTIALPSNEEVAAAWPAAAKAKGLAGSAVAHCVADMVGVLSDCEVMLERSHAGFGQALVSLAPKFRLRRAPEGKRPERADVYITATWPVFDAPPDWQVQPKPGDFSTSYTDAAWKAHKPGEAVMNCMEGRTGALHDCMVFYQDPPGKGFGTTLLRFQGFLRLKPALVAGKPVDAGVNFGMRFNAGGG